MAFEAGRISRYVDDRRSALGRNILVFSFYREAELHGARLLLNLHRHLRDGDSQTKLTRHLADEARHAWLWTQRIAELGAAPVAIADGYQSRLGLKVGVPKDAVDLLALTIVAESRALERYRLHAAKPGVDSRTLEVLEAVSGDEKWHLMWVDGKMRELAAQRGDEARATQRLERYRRIEREVYETFIEDEALLAGN
jgi:hypothetical protein